MNDFPVSEKTGILYVETEITYSPEQNFPLINKDVILQQKESSSPPTPIMHKQQRPRSLNPRFRLSCSSCLQLRPSFELSNSFGFPFEFGLVLRLILCLRLGLGLHLRFEA